MCCRCHLKNCGWTDRWMDVRKDDGQIVITIAHILPHHKEHFVQSYKNTRSAAMRQNKVFNDQVLI